MHWADVRSRESLLDTSRVVKSDFFNKIYNFFLEFFVEVRDSESINGKWRENV